MVTDLVFKYAYEGYTHGFNGRSKQAVKSFTNMYNAGVKNPTQAKFAMEQASKKAEYDYNKTTKNSEIKSFYNSIKTWGRTFVDYIINPEFRKADNAFYNEYNKLYPKTGYLREAIMAERNMP